MCSTTRGQIGNKDRRNQNIDYSGLRYGNITATDLDHFFEYILSSEGYTYCCDGDILGYMEIMNKCHIFLDIKLKGTQIKDGQRLAFERLTDDLQSIKPTIFIIADHECPPEIDIPAHLCVVRKYYYKGHWQTDTQGHNLLKDFIDAFLRKRDLVK